MTMTPPVDGVRRRRSRRVMLASGAGAGACALLVAACGSTAAPGTGAPGSTESSGVTGPATSGTGSSASPTASPASTSAPATSTAKVSLEVSFGSSATGPATVYTLRCDPPGGTVPDPVTACARLLTGPSLFAPKPSRILCPMILETTARATVTGSYFGKQVHVTIVQGGCDLARWAKLKQVFG